MCSFPFHPIPFVPILPCSIRFPSPVFPVFPVGCGVAVLCTTISGLVVGPKGKARGLGWVGPKAVLGVLEFRRRRGKEFAIEDAQIASFFSFFGSLEACMERSGRSSYRFPLFFTPSFFEIAVSLLFLQNVRSITFFVSLLSPLPFLFSFSSFALVSISLSLFLFPFFLCRYTPPIRYVD